MCRRQHSMWGISSEKQPLFDRLDCIRQIFRQKICLPPFPSPSRNQTRRQKQGFDDTQVHVKLEFRQYDLTCCLFRHTMKPVSPHAARHVVRETCWPLVRPSMRWKTVGFFDRSARRSSPRWVFHGDGRNKYLVSTHPLHLWTFSGDSLQLAARGQQCLSLSLSVYTESLVSRTNGAGTKGWRRNEILPLSQGVSNLERPPPAYPRQQERLHCLSRREACKLWLRTCAWVAPPTELCHCHRVFQRGRAWNFYFRFPYKGRLKASITFILPIATCFCVLTSLGQFPREVSTSFQSLHFNLATGFSKAKDSTLYRVLHKYLVLLSPKL